MDRRVTQLIKKIRQRTGNYDSGSNITDDEIIDALNDAQERLQSIIMGAFNQELFRKTDTVSLVSEQYEYDLPVDIFNENFEMIEHTTNTTAGEFGYSRLNPIHPQEKNLVIGYYIRNGKIVSPYSSGTLRRFYIGKPVQIDKRRGIITSLSPLTISGHDSDEALDSDDWITIVDTLGEIKTHSIFITGFNNGTGVISTTNALTGASVDDYVVMGKKRSSHSEYKNNFERYLKAYVSVDLEIHDSNTDFQADSAKMTKFEEEIADMSFGSQSDIFDIAVTEC